MRKNMIMLITIVGMFFLLTNCGQKEKQTDSMDFSNDFAKEMYEEVEDEEDIVSTVSTEPEYIEVDPFDGLKFEIFGISPYCEISINNANCNEEVQNLITYSLDKDFYANGDTAKITASLAVESESESYVLTQTEMEYVVSSQPEYITSIADIDLSLLESELSDYITAEKSAVTHASTKCFTRPKEWSGYESCDDVLHENTWFTSLKKIKSSQFELGRTPFNRISFVYAVDYTEFLYRGPNVEGAPETEVYTGTFWITVSAENIISYPDGRISWGSSANEEYNFVCSFSEIGLEDCVSTTIMANNSDYNIEEITN